MRGRGDRDRTMSLDISESDPGFITDQTMPGKDHISREEFAEIFSLIQAKNVIAERWFQHSVTSSGGGRGVRTRDSRIGGSCGGGGGGGSSGGDVGARGRGQSDLTYWSRENMLRQGFSSVESELVEAFRIFDDSNDGIVTADDLFRAIQALMPEENASVEDVSEQTSFALVWFPLHCRVACFSIVCLLDPCSFK